MVICLRIKVIYYQYHCVEHLLKLHKIIIIIGFFYRYYFHMYRCFINPCSFQIVHLCNLKTLLDFLCLNCGPLLQKFSDPWSKHEYKATNIMYILGIQSFIVFTYFISTFPFPMKYKPSINS